MGEITRGAIAGAIAAFTFTLAHDLLISSIWFMLAPMLLAGALCGAALTNSYAQLVQGKSALSWIKYNLLYDFLLLLVMPISVLIHEPVMTLTQLLNSQGGLPAELRARLLPLVISFTILISIVVLVLYRGSWNQIWGVLLSSSLLMMLLGTNLSALGLITLTGGWQYLLMETTLLILIINGAFTISYLGLAYLQVSAIKRLLIHLGSLVFHVLSGLMNA